MPILDVDKAKTVMVIKRGMSPGFAGIDNELYYLDKTLMLFGDAKAFVGEMKSENVFVEFVGGRLVRHRDAHMDDALGDARIGQELAEVLGVQRTGTVFDEFHVVAVGIFQHHADVAVEAIVQRIRHLHALAGQIVAQLLDVGSFEGDVREAVFRGTLQFGKDLDVLVIVDLEIRQHQPAGRLIDGERLLKAKHVAVELAGSGQIVGLESDVRDSHDGRAILRTGRAEPL
jgi:hypothetical protein